MTAVYLDTFTEVVSGEIAGATSATQLPVIPCRLVKIKAVIGNSGNVYIGGSGVTKVDGTTDSTTGWELDAGEETPWLPIDSLSRLYIICDNAGDDLVYIALRNPVNV